MRRSIAAAVLLAGLVVLTGCGGDDIKTEKLTLFGELDGRSVVDSGKAGPSGGDIYSFSNELRDSNGKGVGDLEGMSVAIPPSAGEGERRAATFQFTLGGGTIIVNGIYEVDKKAARAPKAEGSTSAITGGTGDWRNAGGQVTSTPSGSAIKYSLDIDTPK